MLVVVGGTIPAEDAEELKRLGVAAVFTPGAPTSAIVEFCAARSHPPDGRREPAGRRPSGDSSPVTQSSTEASSGANGSTASSAGSTGPVGAVVTAVAAGSRHACHDQRARRAAKRRGRSTFAFSV